MQMSLNTDPNKQAIEVHFSIKCDKGNYPSLQFNSTDVHIANSQKYLRLILDSELNFDEHIQSKTTRCNKIIRLIKKKTKKKTATLSKKSLLTIYKSFARPNLNYADIIYNKPLNKLFKRKIEIALPNIMQPL